MAKGKDMVTERKQSDMASNLRQQAEQRLAESEEDLKQLSPEEMINLVHELQVHQIELEMQNEEIQRSEERYQNLYQRFIRLYNFAPFGYVVLEKPERIVIANVNAITMLGATPAALIGKPFTDFIPSDEQDKCFLWLRKLFSSGVPQYFILNLKSETGKGIIVKVDAYPEHDAQGDVVSCRLAMSDITELKQTEAALQDSLTQLEEAQSKLIHQERLAVVGQLAAGIAHDFNNILTTVLGNIELIEMSVETPSSIKKQVQAINLASKRAASLIRQILDFSQKTIQKKEPIDLVPFFRELMQFLRPVIPENIEIAFKAERAQYWIEADYTQLQQLFANLIINAKDAMPEGGKLTINLFRVNDTEVDKSLADIDPHSAKMWFCATVHDTGHGISDEHISRIYEPFFTTKDVGKGEGLGLAQVYGIVQQHHWNIEVDSQKNQGTTFAVYFPSYPQAATITDTLVPAKEAENKAKILLVEDDKMVADTLIAMLTRLDYRLISAVNATEAVKIYSQYKHEIDLVISDVVMPGNDGGELFLSLKAQNPDLKMILITGYILRRKESELLNKGIVAWLQKPVSLSELARVVHEALL
ncbi:MAG: response regulator [Anaerolineae bacterium]|nr:response regulator [Anaerolineae bacterium]